MGAQWMRVCSETTADVVTSCITVGLSAVTIARLTPCREQEIRNVMWIAECVAQDQKNRVQDGIVFTF